MDLQQLVLVIDMLGIVVVLVPVPGHHAVGIADIRLFEQLASVVDPGVSVAVHGTVGEHCTAVAVVEVHRPTELVEVLERVLVEVDRELVRAADSGLGVRQEHVVPTENRQMESSSPFHQRAGSVTNPCRQVEDMKIVFVVLDGGRQSGSYVSKYPSPEVAVPDALNDKIGAFETAEDTGVQACVSEVVVTRWDKEAGTPVGLVEQGTAELHVVADHLSHSVVVGVEMGILAPGHQIVFGRIAVQIVPWMSPIKPRNLVEL